MSIENVTYAFQNAATTGVGVTQFFLEPRFTTFRITGNGSVSAGQVTIECCPQKTPMIPGASSAGGMAWTVLTTIPVPLNATTEWFAGSVSGTFRARISTPVTGGTVTVWEFGPRNKEAGAAAHREWTAVYPDML
jgi:hypothetical protein